MGLPSARDQDSSGMGTPMVPQRSRTLLPIELRTLATAVWTRGDWHLRSSASEKRTPDRLSGSAQRKRVSMNATEDEGNFWNRTKSKRRQSHSQGLSWRPAQRTVHSVTAWKQRSFKKVHVFTSWLVKVKIISYLKSFWNSLCLEEVSERTTKKELQLGRWPNCYWTDPDTLSFLRKTSPPLGCCLSYCCANPKAEG